MSGAEEAGAAEAAAAAPAQDLYREKPVSKVVRVMTVMAYLTSVSFAAILLSVYYICIWKSPEAPTGDDPGYLLARRGTHRDYEPAYFSADGPRNLTGRGGAAVSDNGTAALGALNYTFTEVADAAPTPDTSAPDDAPTADTSAPDDAPTADTSATDEAPSPSTSAPDEAPFPDTSAPNDALASDPSGVDELATSPTVRAERPHPASVTADT